VSDPVDLPFTEVLGSEHDAGALSIRSQAFVTGWSRSKRVRKTRAFSRKIKLDGATAVGQGMESAREKFLVLLNCDVIFIQLSFGNPILG
jgi:hypothetical protein